MDSENYVVCIVGLGLMGGSLALAWRSKNAPVRVVGVDRDAATLDQALAAGAIQAGTRELAEGLNGADAVVLATPVRTILRLLPEVGKHAGRGTLVMDLGSSKAAVCAAMDALPEGLQPVGGHPMCGTEHAGFAAAEPALYEGCAFVLCPRPRTAAASLALAERLAAAAGARPLLAGPEEHDRAVASISHLPYAAAVALMEATGRDAGPLAWALAASGFRDTTRLAAANVEVMLDTLLTNREAVLTWLGAYEVQLRDLAAALEAGDEATLRERFSSAHARRRELPAHSRP